MLLEGTVRIYGSCVHGQGPGETADVDEGMDAGHALTCACLEGQGGLQEGGKAGSDQGSDRRELNARKRRVGAVVVCPPPLLWRMTRSCLLLGVGGGVRHGPAVRVVRCSCA